MPGSLVLYVVNCFNFMFCFVILFNVGLKSFYVSNVSVIELFLKWICCLVPIMNLAIKITGRNFLEKEARKHLNGKFWNQCQSCSCLSCLLFIIPFQDRETYSHCFQVQI